MMDNNPKVIVLASHCILNPNSKVRGSKLPVSTFIPLINKILSTEAGIYQIPCPEQTQLGCNRWGQSKEQYDNPFYRKHCRKIASTIISELIEYSKNDYKILFLLGIKGSPSCGIEHTYSAQWGGEISSGVEPGSFSAGSGVFMEELREKLKYSHLAIPMFDVDESDIEGTIIKLTELL